VKTLGSSGNLLGTRWLLKKCTVKMNSAASSASSEWTSAAMFRNQPGKMYENFSGNQSMSPESPMANIPQNTARKSNFSQ
jgi:hypothetical protein